MFSKTRSFIFAGALVLFSSSAQAGFPEVRKDLEKMENAFGGFAFSAQLDLSEESSDYSKLVAEESAPEAGLVHQKRPFNAMEDKTGFIPDRIPNQPAPSLPKITEYKPLQYLAYFGSEETVLFLARKLIKGENVAALSAWQKAYATKSIIHALHNRGMHQTILHIFENKFISEEAAPSFLAMYVDLLIKSNQFTPWARLVHSEKIPARARAKLRDDQYLKSLFLRSMPNAVSKSAAPAKKMEAEQTIARTSRFFSLFRQDIRKMFEEAGKTFIKELDFHEKDSHELFNKRKEYILRVDNLKTPAIATTHASLSQNMVPEPATAAPATSATVAAPAGDRVFPFFSLTAPSAQAPAAKPAAQVAPPAPALASDLAINHPASNNNHEPVKKRILRTFSEEGNFPSSSASSSANPPAASSAPVIPSHPGAQKRSRAESEEQALSSSASKVSRPSRPSALAERPAMASAAAAPEVQKPAGEAGQKRTRSKVIQDAETLSELHKNYMGFGDNVNLSDYGKGKRTRTGNEATLANSRPNISSSSSSSSALRSGLSDLSAAAAEASAPAGPSRKRNDNAMAASNDPVSKEVSVRLSQFLTGLQIHRQKGLYAEEDIKKGEFITWYEGTIYRSRKDINTIMAREDLGKKKETSYFIDVLANAKPGKKSRIFYIIDGYRPETAYMSKACFINNAPRSETNVTYATKRRKGAPFGMGLAIVATQDIPKGTELLTYYGDNYDEELQRQHPEYKRYVKDLEQTHTREALETEEEAAERVATRLISGLSGVARRGAKKSSSHSSASAADDNSDESSEGSSSSDEDSSSEDESSSSSSDRAKDTSSEDSSFEEDSEESSNDELPPAKRSNSSSNTSSKKCPANPRSALTRYLQRANHTFAMSNRRYDEGYFEDSLALLKETIELYERALGSGLAWKGADLTPIYKALGDAYWSMDNDLIDQYLTAHHLHAKFEILKTREQTLEKTLAAYQKALSPSETESKDISDTMERLIPVQEKIRQFALDCGPIIEEDLTAVTERGEDLLAQGDEVINTNRELAIRYYLYGIKIVKDHPNVKRLPRILGDLYWQLGQCYSDEIKEDTDKALKYFDLALEQYNILKTITPSAELHREIAELEKDMAELRKK